MIYLTNPFLVLSSFLSFMVAVDAIDRHAAIRVRMWEENPNIEVRALMSTSAAKSVRLDVNTGVVRTVLLLLLLLLLLKNFI